MVHKCLKHEIFAPHSGRSASRHTTLAGNGSLLTYIIHGGSSAVTFRATEGPAFRLMTRIGGILDSSCA
ncbi:hypothetical protein C7212DRAFT_328981 [Tuber magnatum]|uniref:Uncharacterized protein n=1 Tax=Tuber magnatum TaxID=42249 RepID=A0A317SIQ1_9PEZI|nr:hypothetical protein C7212DRAFT_328981 [Tuber magnatum]